MLAISVEAGGGNVGASPRWRASQEQLVAGAAFAAFVAFALGLDGFLAPGNLAALLRGVAVLGILAVGMAVVVIGRGLDLSQVAVMVIGSAWTLHLLRSGWAVGAAVAAGMGFSLACGFVNGLLVAFAEIPAVFATLAFGILVTGFGRVALFEQSVLQLPPHGEALARLGQGSVAGLPIPALVLALLACAVHLLLTRASVGRFVYAQGDNLETARITGIPVRPLIVGEYMLCALIGQVGGLLLAGSIASVNVSLAQSTLLFDVLMVVVLGGVSLVGGRGGIGSVLAGTALIGVLLNGMTVMNVNSDVKDIVKGLVLLAAIVIDVRLHPRDEETARQGDL